MGKDLVHLANCTSGNIFPDVCGKARPSVILGKEGNGVKMTSMAAFKETMSGGDQVVVGWFKDIEASLVIELSIIKGPIFSFQPVEEGKFFFHLVDGLKD